MVSTRNGKETSSKGGTVKKAPKKAAVGERSLTKEEARHEIASLGKKISYVVCNIKWEFLSAGCY